jgi:hypothetical protein
MLTSLGRLLLLAGMLAGLLFGGLEATQAFQSCSLKPTCHNVACTGECQMSQGGCICVQ